MARPGDATANIGFCAATVTAWADLLLGLLGPWPWAQAVAILTPATLLLYVWAAGERAG